MGLRIPLPVAAVLLWTVIVDRSGVCFWTVVAAVLHECGHLLAAWRLHIPLHQLRLDFLGARIEVQGRMLSYGEEWLLSAAGPLTSLLSAAAAAVFWRYEAARIFSCASIVLGLLNLLPIRTFDGGRMLECLLNRYLGTAVALPVMRLISFLFLFLLWACAVYFLLRVGDGLSLFCFSASLLVRFLESERDEFL